jgi:hypothetical protein
MILFRDCPFLFWYNFSLIKNAPKDTMLRKKRRFLGLKSDTQDGVIKVETIKL